MELGEWGQWYFEEQVAVKLQSFGTKKGEEDEKGENEGENDVIQ